MLGGSLLPVKVKTSLLSCKLYTDAILVGWCTTLFIVLALWENLDTKLHLMTWNGAV
jgi:hypothetical protein